MPRKIHDLKKYGRRGFTKKLAALGIGGGVVANITPEVLAKHTSNPKKEVPRLLGFRRDPEDKKNSIKERRAPPKPEPVFYTIPYDEWVYREGTINAADYLTRILKGRFNSDTISALVGHTIENGHKRRRIEVTLRTIRDPETPSKILQKPPANVEEVKETIPQTIDGIVQNNQGKEIDRVEDIEVAVVEKDEYKENNNYGTNSFHSCSSVACGSSLGPYFNHDYSDVPGGCKITINREHNNTAVCTSATPAWDSSNGRYVLLTAGHCTVDPDYDTDMSDAVDRTVNQNGRIGEVEKAIYSYMQSQYDFIWDAGLVKLDNSFGVVNEIACNDGDNDYDFPIVGSLSKDALNDYQENGTNVCSQGRTRGRCGGTIENVNSTEVNTSIGSDGGDSGGPLMWLDESYDPAHAYIGGIRYGGKTFCPIENILNEWNLTI